MAYEFHLRWYDRTGVLKHAFVDPLTARYTESVDNDEPLVFLLHESHPAVQDFEDFDIIEGRLRNTELGIDDSGDFVRACVGILRNWDVETTDDNQTYYTFYAPDQKHILSWRDILWYAGSANRSEFNAVEAETIMKTLVQYNCTADALIANGRWREGDLEAGMGIDVTVAADGGLGNVLTGSMMGANLLDTLQKINAQAGGDFSFEWQGGNDWTFDFHLGQLGADKSTGADRVLFSLLTNTMSGPRLARRGARATTAIAAGQGEGIDRLVSPVDGPDYAVDNDIEAFVDARQEAEADGRIFRGAAKLDAQKTTQVLSFDVLQTSNQFYSPVAVTGKKTYTVGDLVLATYVTDQVRKIEKISIDWKPPQGGDAWQVSVETSEVCDVAGS